MIRAALLACLLFAAVAMAQTGASVEVRLTDTNKAVPTAAALTLWPTNQTVHTDERGNARFDELSAGEYRIEASAEGYAARDTAFDLSPGERLDFSFVLQKVTTLPDVTVETVKGAADVRIFERREIESSPARSLPDFLNNTAGLDVRSDGTAGGTQTIRIGGSNAAQVLVLVDGRRLQSVGNGEADLSAIPLDWIESIEVSRGSRTDEGGEAIGGVLRITTRNGTDSKEMLAVHSHELSLKADAYPTYNRLSLFRSGKTGSFSSLLSYCRTQGPGDFKYRIIEDDGVGPYTVDLGKIYRRINAGIGRDQLLAKVSSSFSESGAIEATGSMDKVSRGMPGFIAPQLTPEAHQNSSQEALNVRATQVIGGAELEARAAYQHDWRSYEDPGQYSFVHESSEASSEWEGEVRGSAIVRRTQVAAGVSFARESLISEQIANGQAARLRWAGWSQVKQPLWSDAARENEISGDVGLRGETFGSDHVLLPKLGLSYEHSAPFAGGLTVSWGRSYRAPSFYSLFWLDDQTVQGNPDLLPELSNEWTGSAYVSPPLINGLRFEASVSDQKIENLIYWKRTFDNRWKPFNLKKARSRTLDLSAEQALWKDHLRFNAGVNWTEARDATDDRNTGGKYLTFRAPRSYRGTLSAKSFGFEFTGSYRWTSARPVLETNSKWLKEYQVVDVRLSYTCHLKRVQVEPAIGADNLLDEDYRIVRFAPMPGREVYASIRLSQN